MPLKVILSLWVANILLAHEFNWNFTNARLRVYLPISLLSYTVATRVQFYFWFLRPTSSLGNVPKFLFACVLIYSCLFSLFSFPAETYCFWCGSVFDISSWRNKEDCTKIKIRWHEWNQRQEFWEIFLPFSRWKRCVFQPISGRLSKYSRLTVKSFFVYKLYGRR